MRENTLARSLSRRGADIWQTHGFVEIFDGILCTREQKKKTFHFQLRKIQM